MVLERKGFAVNLHAGGSLGSDLVGREIAAVGVKVRQGLGVEVDVLEQSASCLGLGSVGWPDIDSEDERRLDADRKVTLVAVDAT